MMAEVPECAEGIASQVSESTENDATDEAVNAASQAEPKKEDSLPTEPHSDSTSFNVGDMDDIAKTTESDYLMLPSISSSPGLPKSHQITSLPSLLPPPPPPLPIASSILPSYASTCSSLSTTAVTSHQSLLASSFASHVPSTSSTSQTSKPLVPLDMNPTIPLVPVQVPLGKGGVVSLGSKSRGRARGVSLANQFMSHFRSNLSLTMKRGPMKVKRISSALIRGGRRLGHSMSLDDRGVLGLREEQNFPFQEEFQYSQDDMFVSTSFEDKWSERNCAFCCLSESSQLGQGNLQRYDPTRGFSIHEKFSSDDTFKDSSALKKFKSQAFREKGKSPRKQFGEPVADPPDEISQIGHAEVVNPSHLFTSTGHCYSHYMCALWSHGVELTSDDVIVCVDKAVVAALERKCDGCKKYGASIPCRVSDCQCWYHFPCATSEGAFLDLKSIAMVCPPHADKASDLLVDLACMLCERVSPEESLLFCSSCGNHYHGPCLKPPLTITPIIRAGWQCSDCKMCQICRQPGDDIVCGVCDKAYHSVCARPQGLTHSRTATDWKCKSCRVCGDCGSRTPGNGHSSRWHTNFTVCDSCYQLRNKGLACPVCKKAYRAIMQKSMAQCSICTRHVHNQCDIEADLTLIQSKKIADKGYEYICCVCRNNPTARLQAAATMLSLPSPDIEEAFESPQHTSIHSEDSIEMDFSEDSGSSVSPLKPSSSSSFLSTGSSQSSLQSFSSYAPLHTTNSSITSSGFNSSFNKGKPWVVRRGSFPRVRGSMSNKGNLGKKGMSGRKRGASVPPTRKGRGNIAARGYRGFFNYQQVTLQVMDNNQSTGKEEGEENKIVVVNASDKFSLWQDICAMCGSFGQDHEGRLIACAQCGQCYHPYCANVKVNRVVLEKGWRCLDCTVCEGCGERNDEARLVLCEDCDISCHIYCMSPPLDIVPAGIWKCKWCAVCQYCGRTDPGPNSSWQQNYSMCGPCYSMTTCPVCDEMYAEAELIIQCSNCSKWLHASDDSIDTEEQAERCIEKGYMCLMCRSPDSPPPHMLPPSPPPRNTTKVPPLGLKMLTSQSLSAQQLPLTSSSLPLISNNPNAMSPVRSESPSDTFAKTPRNSSTDHWMDGTCLSDVGLHQIQNMTLQPIKKTKNFRGGLRTSRGLSLDSTGSRDMDDDEDDDEEKIENAPVVPQHWVYGMKEGTILNAKDHGNPPDLPEGYYTLPGSEPGTFILRKKRYRNIKTVGIGGFQVRARARKEEEKAKEEAEMDPHVLELKRKRSKWRTKKKIKLLEKFPSYIQEAFFGRSLMDTSNLDQKRQFDEFEDEDSDNDEVFEPIASKNSIVLSQDELNMIQAARKKHELAKQKKEELPPTADPNFSRPHKMLPPHSFIREPSVLQSNSFVRQEEKKPKDVKINDLEDDENSDAIDKLFGGFGAISDDLMEVFNDIKDDPDLIEGDARDQPIDNDVTVSAKITDVLGQGFSLEDIDDIMKNLPEDSSEEQQSSDVTNAKSSNHLGNVKIVSESSTERRLTENPVSVSPQILPPQNTMVRPLPSSGDLVSASSAQTRSLIPSTVPTSSLISRESPNPMMVKGNLPVQQQPLTSENSFQVASQSQPQQPTFIPTNKQQVHPTLSRQPEFVSSHSLPNVPTAPKVASRVGGPSQIIQHVTMISQPPSGHAINTGEVTAVNLPVNHKVALSPFNPSLNKAIPAPSAASSQLSATSTLPTVVSSTLQSPANTSASHVYTAQPSYVQSQTNQSVVSGPALHDPPKSWTSENQSLSLSLEEDEALGHKATKAAVLYTNIHRPTLKTDVASISDRERHIKRVWKNLEADQRKIYTQKARENKKEYFKNKQEQQKALKLQEKESAIAASQSELKTASGFSNNMAYKPQQTNLNQCLPRNSFVQNANNTLSNQSGNVASMQQQSLACDNSNNVKRDPLVLHRQQMALSEEGVSIEKSSHTLPNAPPNEIRGGPPASQPSNLIQSLSHNAPQDILSQNNNQLEKIVSQDPSSRVRHLSNDSFIQQQPLAQQNPPFSQQRPSLPNESALLQQPQHMVQQEQPPLDSQVHLRDQKRQPFTQQMLSQQQNQGPQPSQQLSSPRFQSHFRQPLPPMGLNQQVRVRVPAGQANIANHPTSGAPIDQRMRFVMHHRLQHQMQQTPQQQQQQQHQHLHQQQPQHPLQQQALPQPQLQNQTPSLQQQQQQVPRQLMQHQPRPQVQAQQLTQLHTQQQPQHALSNNSMAQFSNSTHQRFAYPHQNSIPANPMGNLVPTSRNYEEVPHVEEANITSTAPAMTASQSSPLHHPPDLHSQMPQHSTEEPELPEAIARELEEFRLEQQKQRQRQQQQDRQKLLQDSKESALKHQAKPGSELEDMEKGSSSELQQMEEDLLSGMGDIEDFLEYAVSSDQDRAESSQEPKMPQSFFDHLDEVDTKESLKKHEQCMTGVQDGQKRAAFPEHGHSSLEASNVGTPPVPSTSTLVPQGPPSGPTSTPGTPGTPGSHPGTPLTPGSLNQVVPMGPSSGPLIGSPRIPMAGSPSGPIMHPQMQQPHQVQSSPQMQPNPIHQTPGHGYTTRMVCPPGSTMLRHPSGAAHPPPPYPGLAQSFPRAAQEQPLLIEDIIEEEKREQMKQQKAVAAQHQHPPTAQHQQTLSEGPLMGSSGIIRTSYQRLPSQVPSPGYNSGAGPMTIPQRHVRPTGDPGLHPALLQVGTRQGSLPTASQSSATNFTFKTIPPPPMPQENPQTEADIQTQLKYETWLNHQNSLIQQQQRFFESEIGKLRKQRKSLNSRQRTLKKNNQELGEQDAADLERVQNEITVIQRQLEACRKAARQHSMNINDYNNRKRQRQQSQILHSPTGMIPQPIMSGSSPLGPAGSSPMHSTPHSPHMSVSPSSQHSMVMSPMVPSPHTPVASPSNTALPQHSPHSMIVVPTAHPSPNDPSAPFPPQNRMPSPGGPNNYPQPQQMVHPMLGPQGMRVRMPVHSPGTVGAQPGPLSPHMMVIRPSYGQGPPQPMHTQQSGQQMMLRQYPPNVMPMRRPSGSGPVPSPGSAGLSPSHVGPPPSPVSSMGMKPSPVHVHSGLRSPVPLASPQMRPHSTENPGTPLTPRSCEPLINPATPHSEQGFGSQVNSPHHSIMTPTPPSPIVNCGSVSSSNSANFLPDSNSSINGNSNMNASENSNSSDKVVQPQPCSSSDDRISSFPATSEVACSSSLSGGIDVLANSNINNSNRCPPTSRGGGGGGNLDAPIPIPFSFGKLGFFKFGLKGGATMQSRWGHFKIGLKGGGLPVQEDENSVNKNTYPIVTSSSLSTTTTASSVTTTADTSPPSDPLLSNYMRGMESNEEGLIGVLNENIKSNRVSVRTSGCSVSQPAYVSAGSSVANVIPQLSLSSSRVVVPEPAKSEIPPSSRHQAVIGIPGGGAIPSQSSYPTSTVALAPGIRVAHPVSSINFSSLPPSYTAVNAVSNVSSEGGIDRQAVMRSTIASSTVVGDSLITNPLIPAPIMSASTTICSVVASANRQTTAALANDVNTLATVVSASSQVSNVLVSLNSAATKSDHPCLPSVSSIVGSNSAILGTLRSPVMQGNSANLTLNNQQSILSQNLLSSASGVNVVKSSISSTLAPLFSTTLSPSLASSAIISQTVCVTQPSTVRSYVPQTIPGGVQSTQTRPSHPHTLHHFPQHKVPVVLTSGGIQTLSSFQAAQQTNSTNSSTTLPQMTKVLSTAVQQPGGVLVQNQVPNQITTSAQVVQLPSLSQVASGLIGKTTQVVQSVNQYNAGMHAPHGSQLIVHQSNQHHPGSVVLNSGSSHVRMVGQQVMVQQGIIRGNSVMVKSSPQVQGGVRMMMIHNSGQQRTPTPPPISRQTSPMMPPPAAKSPASLAASPIPRVSPAPSPVAHSPNISSPHSPQVKSQSPHMNSPIPSPHNAGSTTPTLSLPKEEDLRKSDSPFTATTSDAELFGPHLKTANPLSQDVPSEMPTKENSLPPAPNALLKQLLQNAACSSNPVQSGQLVLVRSSPGANLSLSSSQLSQIATQVPNQSLALQRSVTENQSNANSALTTNSQTIGSQPLVTQLGRPAFMQQQVAVIGSSVPGALQKSVGSLPVIGHSGGNLPQSLLVSRSSSFSTNTTQPSQVPQANIRQVPSNQVIQHPLTNVAVHQASSGSSKTYQIAQQNASSQQLLMQGSLGRGQQLPQLSQHHQSSSGASVQAVNSPQILQKSNTFVQNASLADRIDNNPSVKTEMRVVIPESAGNCSGPSTGGDQTPEMNTPNDSCDDPEEAKKAKKRAQSQARRKSQTKDNKVQPAKRMRQGSRVEEDYDSFIEGMMAQLRSMPALTIMEPEVPKNFHSCLIFGCGDFSKVNKKDIDPRKGLLEGTEGSFTVKNVNDYYNTKPFGPKLPFLSPVKSKPNQKGFYNQEFSPSKIGIPFDEYSNDLELTQISRSNGTIPREADSPDTVLSSSSPECVMPESPPPFKGLRLIDMDEMDDDHRERSSSPPIPLLVPIPIRSTRPKFEDSKEGILENKENKPEFYSNILMKKKAGLTPAYPLKEMGNVTVTLTLSSNAGQDIGNVLRSLSNLLNIPPPVNYDFIDSNLEHPKLRRFCKNVPIKDGKEIDMQSVLNGAVRFCKNCNVLIAQNSISKKISEMPFLTKEDWAGIDDLSFCSKNCYVHFAITHKVPETTKTASDVTFESPGRNKLKEESFGERLLGSTKITGEMEWGRDGLNEVLKLPSYDNEQLGMKRKLEMEDYSSVQPEPKRRQKPQYKYWNRDVLSLPETYEKPTDKEMTDLLFRMRITYRMSGLPEDLRRCILCHLYGDYVADGPSRLLNYDVDKWVHLNCALWAEDVYETMSGSLMHVELALKKAGGLICEHCERSGASIKCFKPRCTKVYHLNCAVKEGCTFYKNKTVYCQEHLTKGDRENELSTLAVYRRVYIDRDDSRLVASVIHHTEMNQILRIGSLFLINIGQLLPHQLQAFHSPFCIYPIGYHVIRFYWSMRQLHKRCAYECSIHEVDGEPEFRIVIKEDGFEDASFASRSPKGVWNKILEPIAALRQRNDVVKLFPQYISGEDLFGLTEPTIVRILESMPGVDGLVDYNCKYGSNPVFELPLAVNPSGCARAEPFNKTHMKRHFGIRTTVGTVKTGGNLRTAATIASLTMNFDPFFSFGKPFTHSRFYQYKKMKNEWRSTVYLARSKIQGLGLYAARDIEKNTMIIEYIGEIIREELSEIREKRYESQNRGIYMFRLDDARIVDATVTGGLARYINHSCDPSCYTETVEIERELKITIVSNRKIMRGEELAYDYKFDEEEDHKIPCLCGAENCRKWMN